MKKSESYCKNIDIKEALLSKEEQMFLGEDEIFSLIKKDFNLRLENKALNLLTAPNTPKFHKKKILTDKSNVDKKRLPPKVPCGLPRIGNYQSSLQDDFRRALSASKKDKKDDSRMDSKISFDKLLSLRGKFFSHQRLTRGDLTEMMYGKRIPMLRTKHFSEDYNSKILEVLRNAPQLIINLIEFGEVKKSDVIDYFNLNSLKLQWNDDLEKKYRDIVYYRYKTSSNKLKTTFFLVSIGFHKILQQKYEAKHYITYKSYNQKEINQFAVLYDKLKKYDYQKVLEGYSKVQTIYEIRDSMVQDTITKIRNKYFMKKLSDVRKLRNKSEKCISEVNEEKKAELSDYKACLHGLRCNVFKKFPVSQINKFEYSRPLTKINEKILNKRDTKNIILISQIKQSKSYLKKVIEEMRKDGELPSKTKKKMKFEYNQFLKKDMLHKKIINFFASLIEAAFRGYMIRKWMKKMQCSIRKIQIKLCKYTNYKKMVMSLFKGTVEDIGGLDKMKPECFKAPARRIRQIAHALFRNYPSCSFYMFQRDIDQINMLYKVNLVPSKIMVGKVVKSHKLLLFLDNCLFKLYHQE